MKYIEVDGVEGLVEVPDDITDEQILDVGEQLTQGRVQSAAGAMMRQGGSMWGKAAQGLSRIAQVLGNSGLSIGPGGAVFSNPDAAMAGARMTGAEKQKQLEEDPTYQFGENLAAGAEEAFPVNPLYADKLDTAVASGLGSVIALAPSALAGGAAPLVAGGGYGVSAGESGAEDAQAILDSRIQSALEQGDINTAAKLEQDKFSIETAAFLLNAPIGAATEGVLGVAGRMAGMARGKGGVLGGITDKVVESIAKSQTVKRGVEGFVSESLQEGLEQGAGNAVAKVLYDPERDLTEGVGMSMLGGGIVGGGVGGGVGALADRSRNTVAPTVPEVTIAPESANEVQAMLDALEAANKVTKDNFTDAEAITPDMEVPVDVTPPSVEAPVDITPPPPTVDEQADLQAELDAQVTAGTVEEPPVPESPDQIDAQLEATLDPESTKAVTLVTPGEELPPIPEGLEVGEPTEAGIPIFNPEKITPEAVTEAGQGDVYDPSVLGLGAEVAQSDTAVTTSTPEGTPVLEELVTPETVTAAIEAQQAAVPGGVTEVKPAAQVVAKRRDDATPTPTTVDEAADWLTAREPGFFGEGLGKKWAGKVFAAIESGKYDDIFHPRYAHPRALFTKLTGVSLPKSIKGTEAVFTGKPFPLSSAPQASTTPAPEAPTQGQPTPTPPGSAPSPDAGKQGVGVQSQKPVDTLENLTKTRNDLEAKRKAEDAKPRKNGLRSKKAIDLNREIDALDLKISDLKKAAQENVQPETSEVPQDLAAEIDKQKTGTGPLTREELVELNELRAVNESRGKLGMLSQARVDNLESREKEIAPISNPSDAAVEPVKAQQEEVSKTEKQKQSLPPIAPKAQKQFLLDETEKAIAEAPEEAPMTSEAAVDRKAIEGEHREEKLAPYFEKYGVKKINGEGWKQSELRLTEAVYKAYFDQADKVRIEVPGDGIFTIFNNKKALKEFYERAKKFPTTTPKSKTPSTPRTGQSALPAKGSMTKPNILKALSSHLSENEQRAIIELIYSDGESAVATDGRRMLIVDTNLGGSKKSPVTLTKEGTPKTGDREYPNWKQVLPDKKSYEATIGKVNIRRLWGVLRQAKESTDDKTKSVILYLNSDKTLGVRAVKPESGSVKQGDFSPGMSYVHNVTPNSVIVGLFDVNYLLDALESHNRLGAEDVDIHYTASNSPIVMESKGANLVLMPMRSTGPKEEETKKGAVQAIVTSGSKSAAERALKVLDAIEKKIDSNTYSDPLLLTVFAKLAIKLARQLIKGGMAINQAIRQAVADARKQMPDAPDDDAAVADKIEREIQAEDAKAGTGELLTPAPGEKVQESKGRFTGLVSKDTDKEWQQQAEEWLSQFGDDLETAYQKTISPVTPVDAALRQYVLTELLARTDAAIKTKNPVTQMAMLKFQAAIADSLKDSGKQEFGTVGAARALALKRIEWLMPVLMFRGLVKDAQSRLPFPDITSDKVRDWLKRAGSKAVSEVRKAMKDADNVVSRELKREVKDLGVNWGDIIRSSEAVQGDFRRALYRTVLEHPKLTGITPKAVTEIVNLLANEWERQRLRIFRQEFAKEVKLPGVSDKTMNRLEEAIPAIVIQANVGLLDNEAFRNAVAPKFGVEQFDGKTADLVYKLAQEAQGMKGVNRTKLLNRITDTIQRAGGVSKSDVFRDYWFAAMLSGIRTMVDNGLSILNGGMTTALAAMSNPKAAPLMTRAYLGGLAEAGSDFVPILKGERWRTHNVDIDRPASALDAMLASPNPFKKAIGSAAYVSRLISALDHLNALSTRQAMMAWAAMRSDPVAAKAMLEVSPEQREAAREQAIQEGTEKSLLRKRTREILEERVPIETIITATNLGLLASFQNDPYGVAGHFYQFIKRLDKLPGFGKFTRLVSGVAFARYALNYTNDILNYVSPIGIMRWYASSPGMQDKEHGLKITEEERQLIMMKSVMGSLVAAAAAAVFLGDDDDDEKKRAIDITGSFKSLDPEKRNQLLSEGRQPYSIRFGDTYVSYRQLPIAGVLGTVGEMRDKQLFDKEAWKAQNPASTVANAAIAGMFIVRDSSSLTGLMDLLGFASAYKYDTEAMVDKSIPRFVAKLLGGMIPNIAKEIDAWQDPSIYKATQGWEYFLQQVPWGRRGLEPGPQVNVLGEKIAVERLPWSRWVRERSKDPVWDTMGKLADKGIFMPMPGKFTVQNDDGTRREPTKKEMYDYQKAVGESYKDWIKDDGRDLLDMEPAEAKRLIDRTTTRLRKQARMELGL